MGYNEYQQAHYTAITGTKVKHVQSLYDLKYQGKNVSLCVPYPVAVAKRNKKVKDGWRKNDFKIENLYAEC